MTDAVCAKKGPYKMELAAGDYYWCACGRSKNQPFCDGSHSGTDISPVKFTVTQKETRYMCGCRASKGAPFCDGSHNHL